jgi:hypothetical protein
MPLGTHTRVLVAACLVVFLAAGPAGAGVDTPRKGKPKRTRVTTPAPRTEAVDPITPAWWVADFETCDLSQWQRTWIGERSEFAAVPAPDRPGHCAGRATVAPLAAREEHSIVWMDVDRSRGYPGNEMWLRFSVRFPTGFVPTDGEWNWWAEWHNNRGYPPCCEYANVAWTVKSYPHKNQAPYLAMRVLGGQSEAPVKTWVDGPTLQLDHWYEVVFHVVWSNNPDVGLAEWWIDGQLLFSQRLATLFRRPGGESSLVNIDLGYYRMHAHWPATVYYDDARLGPTRDSVTG